MTIRIDFITPREALTPAIRVRITEGILISGTTCTECDLAVQFVSQYNQKQSHPLAGDVLLNVN
jgi:hypothetical protein